MCACQPFPVRTAWLRFWQHFCFSPIHTTCLPCIMALCFFLMTSFLTSHFPLLSPGVEFIPGSLPHHIPQRHLLSTHLTSKRGIICRRQEGCNGEPWCVFKKYLLPSWQVVSPENIHTSSIIWTEQFIFRNTYVCTYAYTHTIASREKKEHTFEGGGEVCTQSLLIHFPSSQTRIVTQKLY